VYNINHGRNPEILAKSKTLNSYSLFIAKIRENNGKLPIDESVKTAIQYCIENDILCDFLREHGSEVRNMLTDDISVEEIAAIRYKEGHEDGHTEGCEEERRIIAGNLLTEGLSPEFIQKITGLSFDEIEKLK
jgi:hypothetical protein